jgi:hypothetical protein
VEKYNTLRVDISLKLRQMRAQKNKSENKDKKETNDTEEDSESQTLSVFDIFFVALRGFLFWGCCFFIAF